MKDDWVFVTHSDGNNLSPSSTPSTVQEVDHEPEFFAHLKPHGAKHSPFSSNHLVYALYMLHSMPH